MSGRVFSSEEKAVFEFALTKVNTNNKNGRRRERILRALIAEAEENGLLSLQDKLMKQIERQAANFPAWVFEGERKDG